MSDWHRIDDPQNLPPKDGTKIRVVCVDEDGKWWDPDIAWWDKVSERFENGSNYVEWPLTHWMHITPPKDTPND